MAPVKRILLVDPARQEREQLAHSLGQAGYLLIIAEDGALAHGDIGWLCHRHINRYAQDILSRIRYIDGSGIASGGRLGRNRHRGCEDFLIIGSDTLGESLQGNPIGDLS